MHPVARLAACHRQLTVAGYRCHRLRTRLEELEARVIDTPLTSASLVLILMVLVLLACAYGTDVLLLRALAEFVAGLASEGLEEAARWLVPAIILGLEVFASWGRARERTRPDPVAIYDEKPGIEDRGWLLLGGVLLVIQPLGATAQYLALQAAAPGFDTQNAVIGLFLLAVGLVAHLSVLLYAGTYLTAATTALEQTIVTAKVRQLRDAYHNATQELLRHYRFWLLLRDQQEK